MELSEIITSFGGYGFPSIVCMYVLIRIEATLKENTKVINALVTRMEYLNVKGGGPVGQ